MIPDDDTTLFVCSGMQNFKPWFREPDRSNLATLQSCIRTNDLDLVGDGTHLTYFEMLGNFSFEGTEYIDSQDLWTAILDDLGLRKDCVIHVHPDSSHRANWLRLGFEVVKDPECVWSDGDIGGYCSEVYWRGIEIGNLVNTNGTMTDVGFGWERLYASAEGKERVDETDLFDQTLPPKLRDHSRTLDSLWDNGVKPGNKGRNYICRKLLRKMLPFYHRKFKWSEWLEDEWGYRERALTQGRKMWRKHKDKSPQWWFETCGLTEDDLKLLDS